MKKYSKLTLGFIALFFCTAAAEVIAPGHPCDTLGVTTMSTDQTSIVACLKNKTDNKLYWKSTTDADLPSGSLCGLAYVARGVAFNDKRGESYTRGAGLYSAVKCNGQNIMSLDYRGIHPNCPTGYSFTQKSVNLQSGSFNSHIDEFRSSVGVDSGIVATYFCVKN